MSGSQDFLVAELARFLRADYQGPSDLKVSSLAPIAEAGPSQLGLLFSPSYAHYMAITQAEALLIPKSLASSCTLPFIASDRPRLAYARLSHYFSQPRAYSPGIHPTAIVEEGGQVHPTAHVGPYVVCGAMTEIGPGAVILAHTVLGRSCKIGEETLLYPRVTLYDGVVLGARCVVHSGAVLGADGFGFEKNEAHVWEKIVHLGGLEIADDVEIGANTAIDRGSLGNTQIGSNVKIDNLVQMAHNVTIGEGTAIAGCAGIAGSTHIGKHCLIGGGSGIRDHVRLGDHVYLTGMSMASRDLLEPGIYSSGTGVQKNQEWRRSVVAFQRQGRRNMKEKLSTPSEHEEDL